MAWADWEGEWQALSEEVYSGMADWRAAHPRATFAEIEAAVEERLAGLRARLLERAALASAAPDLSARPPCPTCGGTVQARGKQKRRLTAPGDQVVELERTYAGCPQCGTGFFPLDEELALEAGSYAPFVHASIVRLGTWLPFERVPAVLAHFPQVPVSAETARRLTERAGALLEAAETAAVQGLEAANRWPPAPAERLQVSVDGAMVPLVHRAWAEAKTLVVGTVTPGAPPHTTVLSYFSRLTEADVFRRLAWVETQRRGVPAAPDVCGVVDGADWCQRFLDWHCPDAVRILDFPHAAEYVSAAGRSVFGAETPALTAWLDQQLTELKDGDPAQVLAALAALPRVFVPGPDGEHCPRDTAVNYLTKRQAQIAYATFQAAGYPIGSGIVESANKLVVEARLKGSGMHWARANVNPLLALRGAACSDRWDAAWATLTQQRHQQRATARACRAATRHPAPPAPRPARRRERLPKRPRRGTMCDGRPTAAHHWRRDGLRAHAAGAETAKT